MTHGPRTRLVWRLYAIGVLQFAMFLVAALGIGFVWARLPQRWDMPSLVAHLKPLAHDRAALGRELDKLRLSDKLLVSVYDDNDELLGTNVEPALRPHRFGTSFAHEPASERAPSGALDDPPRAPGGALDDPPRAPGALDDPPRAPGGAFGSPPPPPLGALADHRPPPLDIFGRFEIDGRDGLLIARLEHTKPSLLLPIVTVLAGLFVTGVGAVLTARWIARPLSHLSSVALALGRGDLRARAELTRNDEVGDVARAFDDMAERVQRLLRTEKELLANVAHELRTPLARIRVALEIAGEGDAETVRASLGEIAVDLNELETLVRDVFTAARFDSGDGDTASAVFALHRQLVAPEAIAARAAELFIARHPDRLLSVEIGSDLPEIDADPMLLRRVVDNLLDNAHKYSSDPNTEIYLAVSHADRLVCFEVRDRGMGIAELDVPRLFSAFFRSDRSRSRGTGGIGLGLTLVQRIVEAHGGRVEVESQVGIGSRFRAFLPTRAPAHGAGRGSPTRDA